MWISKKRYNELIEQKNDFERIATNAVTQNGRLLDEWHEVLEEMKGIQELNRRLVERNEGLLDHCRELEAKFSLVVKERDYYYSLLENTSEVEEKDE